ncbi:hypothetical protein DRP05_00015 [Archaeoglobales archaeon]|nr:MAG: hypothetical protein DRP05_00015 [Archaeoglobales archaeon]
MTNWKNFKNKKLKSYEIAKREKDVDEDIVPLLDLINSKDDFVTLSSCSGRIAVIDIPEFGDKINSEFLGKWHDEVYVDDIIKAAKKGKKTTWLITYPPIIHVACSNLDSAEKLMNIANNAGFRRSGLISLKKFVVEISSLERLELPIAMSGKMVLDDKTIRIMVDFANKKLLKGKEKLNRLEKLIKSNFD